MAKQLPSRYRVIAIYGSLGGDFDDLEAAEECFNSINPSELVFRNGVKVHNGSFAVLIDTLEAKQLKANHFSLINKSPTL